MELLHILCSFLSTLSEDQKRAIRGDETLNVFGYQIHHFDYAQDPVVVDQRAMPLPSAIKTIEEYQRIISSMKTQKQHIRDQGLKEWTELSTETFYKGISYYKDKTTHEYQLEMHFCVEK